MNSPPILLPAPRTCRYDTYRTLTLPPETVYRIDAPNSPLTTAAVGVILKALHEAFARHERYTDHTRANANIAISLKLITDGSDPQGYVLSISDTGVDIRSAGACGLFYAAQTLAQLLRQFGPRPPYLEIIDAPDFPTRGVLIDISRDKVPTMETLFAFVDQLAEWKFNQFQLYTEHTFAFQAHPDVWANASPMTGAEIEALDAYCRERFIDLVPNQNSFGHLERWLRLPPYRDLAEAPQGSRLPWGSWWEGPAGLNPLDPRSLELIFGLYDDLLPHFSSNYFNVGCDETFDLGQGKSKIVCERIGKHRVYLNYLLKIHERVRTHGRVMQFWGDIILHEPALIAELPRDVIALQWGYTAGHPFDRDGAHFAQAGVPFYVCPGTSSWQSFAGRTDNAMANLRNAAVNGRKHGAIGYLVTDWGDLGHHQYQSVALLPFAAGAGFGWCYDANQFDRSRGRRSICTSSAIACREDCTNRVGSWQRLQAVRTDSACSVAAVPNRGSGARRARRSGAGRHTRAA